MRPSRSRSRLIARSRIDWLILSDCQFHDRYVVDLVLRVAPVVLGFSHGLRVAHYLVTFIIVVKLYLLEYLDVASTTAGLHSVESLIELFDALIDVLQR